VQTLPGPSQVVDRSSDPTGGHMLLPQSSCQSISCLCSNYTPGSSAMYASLNQPSQRAAPCENLSGRQPLRWRLPGIAGQAGDSL
jgi:hypothetical protein